MTLRRYDCLSNEDYVFVKEWMGTSQGCLINKDAGIFDYSLNDVVDYKTWQDKYRCTRNRNNQRRGQNNCEYWEEQCQIVRSEPPVEMFLFNDKAFCGNRGGDSFMDM